MKKISRIFSILTIIILFGCNSNTNNINQDRALPYRIANKDEAIKYYLSNDDYFNSLSKYDIQYRTQSKDGTIESLKEYGASQMLELTDIKKMTISNLDVEHHDAYASFTINNKKKECFI